MLFMESYKYFCKNEYFSYGEINERSISNPTLGVNKLRLFRNDMTKIFTSATIYKGLSVFVVCIPYMWYLAP